MERFLDHPFVFCPNLRSPVGRTDVSTTRGFLEELKMYSGRTQNSQPMFNSTRLVQWTNHLNPVGAFISVHFFVWSFGKCPFFAIFVDSVRIVLKHCSWALQWIQPTLNSCSNFFLSQGRHCPLPCCPEDFVQKRSAGTSFSSV